MRLLQAVGRRVQKESVVKAPAVLLGKIVEGHGAPRLRPYGRAKVLLVANRVNPSLLNMRIS